MFWGVRTCDCRCLFWKADGNSVSICDLRPEPMSCLEGLRLAFPGRRTPLLLIAKLAIATIDDYCVVSTICNICCLRFFVVASGDRRCARGQETKSRYLYLHDQESSNVRSELHKSKYIPENDGIGSGPDTVESATWKAK